MANHKPVHPGDQVTDEQVRRILTGLRARTLPKPEWTHGAHLCAGVGLIQERGISRAESEMPGFIRAYNEATGVPNTDDEGYHHTLTIFYLRALNAECAGHSEKSVGGLASIVLGAPIADRAYPLRFYEKATLFSVAARRGWVTPDLQKAPW